MSRVTNRAGRMRDRVTIQTRATGYDKYGDPSETWNTVDVAWAYVQPLQASERFAAEQQEGTVQYKVTMRYRDDFGAEDRLVVTNGPTLDIQGIVNVQGMKSKMEVNCFERTANDGP